MKNIIHFKFLTFSNIFIRDHFYEVILHSLSKNVDEDLK